MKMHFTKMLTVCCAILFGAFLTTDAFAQGNTCATAQVLTASGSYTADGPSDGVSSTICETTAGAFADWYSFTPAANGLLSVNSCDGGADTQLSIFSGTCAALVCEGSSDDASLCISSGTSNFASRVENLAVVGGTTYYIQWDNDWTINGFDWSLDFNPLTDPDCNGVVGGLDLPGTPCDDNDAGTVLDTWDENCNCVGIPVAANNTPCTATALACGDTVADQNFIGATADGTDDCSGTGTADVYFSFTADGTQTYTIEAIDQDGTFFDGVVELLSGPCSDLTVVGACLDFPERYEVTEAGDYTFRVRPWSAAETDQFSVSLLCTPFDCPGIGNIGDACDDGNGGTVNDAIQEDCSCLGQATASNNRPCTATALACNDTLSGQSLFGATAFGDDDCSGTGTADVYYSFIADGTQTYTVTVIDEGGTFFDGVVELLEGPNCVTTTVVGECLDFPESYTVTAAGNYILRVRAWSEAEVDGFGIALECTPFDCPGLGNIGDACDDGDANSINDAIQADCTCAGLLPASNDTPCTAAVLDCGATITGETLAVATASSVTGCDIAQDLDLWYSVSVPDTARFDQIDQTGFMDAFIEVYAVNSSCTDLDTLITCQDFDENFLDGVNLSAGNYLIRILGETSTDVEDVFDVTLDCFEPDCPDGSFIGDACDDGDANTGNDTVQEDCSCAGIPLAENDNPCLAPFLSCGDTLTDQSLLGATAFGTDECGGSGTADVYYAFIADGTQAYTISIIDETFSFDGVVELLTGPNCTNLTVVGECSDFPESFTVTEGGAYVFRVRGFSDTETDGFGVALTCSEFECPGLGNIGLPCDDGDAATENDVVQEDCTCAGTIPPANDDCSDVNAAFLLNCGESIDSSTEGAAVTPGLSATCSGFTTGSPEDVWFAFQADGTSSYTVTVDTSAATASSLMDAVLFVYSGACGELVEEACADDNFPAGFSGETITLETPAAGVYYVRVINFRAGGEPFTISLECDDNCEDPFPAVDEASLSTTFTGNSFLTEWDAVAGQIGCQIRVRLAGTSSLLGAQIIGGAGASSFNIPGGVLQPGTDYEWQVRCGCSQTPLVAGPFTTWQPFSTPGGAAISSLPNPTEGQSNVTFTVAEDSYTTLEVFDMSGRLVDGLFAGNAQAGNDYRFEFDGSNLPNGVYIYRLTTENEVINDKFMIAK